MLRDQLFSADMDSAAGQAHRGCAHFAQRAQFPEDSGPLAHPIRPDSYQEISNFYTAHRLQQGRRGDPHDAVHGGPDGFRQGTDLYFARHDGQAATCEDFVKSIEDGAGLDLTQFRRWYEQAGTPQVDRAPDAIRRYRRR